MQRNEIKLVSCITKATFVFPSNLLKSLTLDRFVMESNEKLEKKISKLNSPINIYNVNIKEVNIIKIQKNETRQKDSQVET